MILSTSRPSPSSRCDDAAAVPAPARLPEEEDEAGSEDTHEEELLDYGRPGINWVTVGEEIEKMLLSREIRIFSDMAKRGCSESS